MLASGLVTPSIDLDKGRVRQVNPTNVDHTVVGSITQARPASHRDALSGLGAEELAVVEFAMRAVSRELAAKHP